VPSRRQEKVALQIETNGKIPEAKGSGKSEESPSNRLSVWQALVDCKSATDSCHLHGLLPAFSRNKEGEKGSNI